jgi:hypothetical protein
MVIALIDAWLIGNRQQLRCSYAPYHALAQARRATRKRREIRGEQRGSRQKMKNQSSPFSRERGACNLPPRK